MRRVILGVAVAALSISATANVSAQDILRSMFSPVSAVNWTGFYVGGNFGYGWANADSTATGVSVASTSYDMKGSISGAQLGVNVQSGFWMFGFESDLQYAWQKGDGGTAAALFSAAGVGVPASISESNKVTWFGTTRARLGIASDRLLVFGTAGVAYGQFKFESHFGSGGSYASTTSRIGWAVGGGAEAMLTRNWTLKAEYLHLDFGGFDDNFIVNNAIPVSLHTRLTNDIVRFGVNYMFR